MHGAGPQIDDDSTAVPTLLQLPCVAGEWGEWGACSASCGGSSGGSGGSGGSGSSGGGSSSAGGQQQRRRAVLQRARGVEGLPCPALSAVRGRG